MSSPPPSSTLSPVAPDAIPVVILGADAVLAAQPATAVQLAQACVRAGYATAIPGSWGDELVARATLDALAERPPGPVIHCACPHVANRLATPGTDISRFVVAVEPPPVATARFLRALPQQREQSLHITFVGGCPGADDPAIDARFTPDAFLRMLQSRGISPVEQPTVFDSIIPPDRRRHLSLPGGLPAPDALWERGGGRRLVEITSTDDGAELAQHLLSGESLLIDLAPRVGCSCSGAGGSASARSARLVLSSLEPPRSTRPVLDDSVQVALTTTLVELARRRDSAEGDDSARETATRDSAPRDSAPRDGANRGAAASAATDPRATPDIGHAEAAPPTRVAPAARPPSPSPTAGVRRRTPSSITRLSTGSPPLARSGEGRLLPRAYVARARLATPPSVAAVPATTPDEPVTPAPAAAPTAPVTDPGSENAPAAPQKRAAPDEYQRFVHDVARLIERHVPISNAPAPRHPAEWHQRLDAAIAFYRAQGYRTAILERTRSLPDAPDVDALLRTFAGAVAHLRRLEETATTSYPALRGEPVFRDPERLEAAERFVARLFLG